MSCTSVLLTEYTKESVLEKQALIAMKLNTDVNLLPPLIKGAPFVLLETYQQMKNLKGDLCKKATLLKSGSDGRGRPSRKQQNRFVHDNFHIVITNKNIVNLVCDRHIREHDILGTYTGIVRPGPVAYLDDPVYYSSLEGLDSKQVLIDATTHGSVFRFIRRSAELANITIERVDMKGWFALVVRALVDIEPYDTLFHN